MRLTRGKKIALGIATAWAPLYLILFCGFIAFMILGFAAGHGGVASKGPSMPFLVILPFHFFTMLLGFALLLFYVLHALQNEKLEQNARTLWAILIFVGQFIAMSIYYYKYILPLQDDTG